jgi:hypothetical protein
MNSYRRAALFALGFLCIALAACGSRTTPVVPQVQPLASNTRPIVRAVRDAGGAVIDAGGSAQVAILPRALGGDRVATVVWNDGAVSAPPNPAWSMVGGTVAVTFDRPLGASSATSAALRLSLEYPADRAAEILQANMPLTIVTYAGGRTARLGFDGTFDTVRDRVSVEIPEAALNGAVAVRLGLAVDNVKYTLPPPGPRYWNGTGWSKTGTVDPSKRTLVFIHGIFSSVETAFPNPCTPQIMKAGGYTQALGWDYNWTNPPQVEGPKFAAFLNSLKGKRLNSFDVEAHSYGSVVSYAAVPSVKATMNAVVTLGGPLPLRGSPLARGSLLRKVLVALAAIFVGPPSLINHAYESGMVKSLATNGSEMRAILAGVNGMKTKPAFVDVAGTKEYPEEAYLYPFLVFYITYPWDGIVERIAANSKNVPNSFPNHFHYEHTELECAAPVIAYVGSRVKPKK